MILCPNCKEDIDDDSHYCDQCGQALFFCDQCGRVGMGRRCTFCGGRMVTPDEFQKGASQTAFAMSMSVSASGVSYTASPQVKSPGKPVNYNAPRPNGVPTLVLTNTSLNIRIQAVNGAVIGRRQGPYSHYFEQNMYVSGVHAQLKYNGTSGWCIVDKHSSNGTKLNQHSLQPDVEMSLKNGDIVSIANVNLQVSIN